MTLSVTGSRCLTSIGKYVANIIPPHIPSSQVRWTKAYRKIAGKELVEDATFEMERKRNRPEKYNRETVAKTLQAMDKISEIRIKRQERFYEKRMLRAKQLAKIADKVELETEIHLVRAPAGIIADKEKIRVSAKNDSMQE